MSKRLNTERQKHREPIRMQLATHILTSMGYTVFNDDTKLWFDHLGSKVTFYPYSGWATGKTIKDGRGLENLTKQLR